MSHLHHGHSHFAAGGKEDKAMDWRLLFSILLNGVIVFAEVAGGLISGSLSLLSDALHNLTDVASMILALVARKLSRRPPTKLHTYGFGRTEVVSALVNAIAVLVIGTLVCREAILRLLSPQAVGGRLMLVVALIGLVANLASVLLIKDHDRGDLNMRGAFLHLVQDTLSSVVVVLAAIFSGWRYGMYLDPIASILVIAMIVRSSWTLLKDSLHVLLESTPPGLDIEALQHDIRRSVQNTSIHHLHVWEIQPGRRLMTAHVCMDDMLLSDANTVLDTIHARLSARWKITHAVLEPEFGDCKIDDPQGVSCKCGA